MDQLTNSVDYAVSQSNRRLKVYNSKLVVFINQSWCRNSNNTGNNNNYSNNVLFCIKCFFSAMKPEEGE